MRGVLKVYYPILGAGNLSAAVSYVLQGQARLEELSPACLRLEALNCFFIRFKGSLMHSRAPFVYPLMDEAYHKYYLTERNAYPRLAPGADWVFLGGDPADFCAKLFQHVRLNNIHTVQLAPFTEVTGELAEARQPGDVNLTLVKTPCFHNDTHVQKHKDMLLTKSPDEWDTNAYPLVIDRYESIAGHILPNLRRAPRSIIELGCGLGNTTHRLAREFPEARVVGYDFSPHSIEVCRKTFDLPNLGFEIGDFTS
ncbi:MAG: methyltransferase domain-containing protein, partial [Desulfovibrionaceae bacterium]